MIGNQKLKDKLKGTGDLEDDTETSLHDILVSLLDGEKNLELKTEITMPKDLAVLKSFAEVLKMEDFPKSSELIVLFLETYFKYMVSYNRKSRTEIIKAIEGLLEREAVRMTISDRLTTNLKK